MRDCCFGTASLDAVIRSGDQALGTVRLEHTDTPHGWTEDEITFAGQLADQVALTIANRHRRQTEAATLHISWVGMSASRVSSDKSAISESLRDCEKRGKA